MAQTLQQERDQKLSLIRHRVTIIEIIFLYLLVDYTALRLTNTGGNLFWQNRYREENVVARFDYWPNANPPIIKLDSRIMYHVAPPGRITVLESALAPFWAPIHKVQPDIVVDYPANAQLPTDFTAQATACIAKFDPSKAEKFQLLLKDASKPMRLDYIGLARTTIASAFFVGLCIVLLCLTSLLIRVRSLSRSMRLRVCTCGYSLTGLTSPTCPECGRVIAATPTPPPTTLDA